MTRRRRASDIRSLTGSPAGLRATPLASVSVGRTAWLSGPVGLLIAVLTAIASGQSITNTYPGVFVDISTTGGTALSGASNDSEHNIITTVGNLLFPAGNVRIGNNGVAVSGVTTGDVGPANAAIGAAVPAGIPTGNGILLPFWDDLNVPTGSASTTLWWQEDIANNVLYIMWRNEDHFGFSNFGQTISFEVKVFGSAAPGMPWIQFLYPDSVFGGTAAANDNGASATIGYVKGLNTVGTNLQWSFNTGLIGSGTTLTILGPTVVPSLVQLQQGTATFTQPILSPDQVYDGLINASNNGWATGRPNNTVLAETAVFETSTDISAAAITFDMRHQSPSNAKMLLGCFRWSVTTDNRSTFADGLDNNGDVSATWTILSNPTSVQVPSTMAWQSLTTGANAGAILTIGPAASVPSNGDYLITFAVPSLGAPITGIRLEALEHPTLPGSGPGWHPSVAGIGLFFVTELFVSYFSHPVMVFPPIQTVPAGGTYGLQIVGPPGSIVSLMIDTVPWNVPVPPYGVLGVSLPAFVTFDGIGLGFVGSTPWPIAPGPTIGPSGVLPFMLGPIPPTLIGQTFYAQAVAQHPSLPSLPPIGGFALSTHGGAALPTPACQANIVGASGGSTFTACDLSVASNSNGGVNSGWPIEISDVSNSYASGPPVRYVKRSRTFHVNDKVELRADVYLNGTAAINLQVRFVVYEVLDQTDNYTTPSPTNTKAVLVGSIPAPFFSTGCGTIASGAQSTVELDMQTPGFNFQAGHYYGVHATLEQLSSSTWTPIQTTTNFGTGVPQLLSNEQGTPWWDNVFYVTNADHVVLVHGWNGTQESFGRLDMLLETQQVDTDRRPVRAYKGDTTTCNAASIPQQATYLGYFLSDPVYGIGLQGWTPAIVAHSMGGLVARSWILGHLSTVSTNADLVCLGTPHHGTPITSWTAVCPGPTGPALVDMTPGSSYIRGLDNAWLASAGTVRAMDIIGHCYPDLNGSGLHDGVVPLVSARMIHPAGSVHVQRYLSGWDHTQLVGLFCSGTNHMVPVDGPSHPVYELVKEFVVDGSNTPTSAGAAAAVPMSSNRGQLYVLRLTSEISEVGSPFQGPPNVQNPELYSGKVCDVYWLPLSGPGTTNVMVGVCVMPACTLSSVAVAHGLTTIVP